MIPTKVKSGWLGAAATAGGAGSVLGGGAGGAVTLGRRDGEKRGRVRAIVSDAKGICHNGLPRPVPMLDFADDGSLGAAEGDADVRSINLGSASKLLVKLFRSLESLKEPSGCAISLSLGAAATEITTSPIESVVAATLEMLPSHLIASMASIRPSPPRRHASVHPFPPAPRSERIMCR